MCGRHHHRGRRRSARAPKREEFLSALEERQKDLEQEIADIHDLIKRCATRSRPSRLTAEPAPSI